MDPLRSLSIHVGTVDLAVIAVYLIGIVAAGILLTKLASKNIESYFLGGRRLPWWLLGLSGTASYFDVAGVMWTIALFYTMGMRFFWIQWEWGFLATACFAAFMGKWLRRTGVMTGAEWMTVRFGEDRGGQLRPRVSYAVMAVVIADRLRRICRVRLRPVPARLPARLHAPSVGDYTDGIHGRSIRFSPASTASSVPALFSSSSFSSGRVF